MRLKATPDGDVGEAWLLVRRPKVRGGTHSHGFEHAAAVQDVGHRGRVGNLDLFAGRRRGHEGCQHPRSGCHRHKDSKSGHQAGSIEAHSSTATTSRRLPLHSINTGMLQSAGIAFSLDARLSLGNTVRIGSFWRTVLAPGIGSSQSMVPGSG